VMSAGYLNVKTNYLPKGLYLLVVMSIVLMVLMTIVFIEAFYKWYELLQVKRKVVDKNGDLVLADVPE